MVFRLDILSVSKPWSAQHFHTRSVVPASAGSLPFRSVPAWAALVFFFDLFFCDFCLRLFLDHQLSGRRLLRFFFFLRFFSHPVIKSAIANSTRINPAIFFFIICPFFLQILCPDFQKELMRQHLNPNFQFFPVVCTWSFVPHSKCFHIRYSGTGVRIKVSVILLLYILCLTLKSPLHS